MAVEPYSRIVVDQSGAIVMVAHLDKPDQYNDPAFTQPGCANADMARDEYEAAAQGPLQVQTIGQVASNSISSPGADEQAPAADGPDFTLLLQQKALLQLAQSKLEDQTFIDVIQIRIDGIDADMAAQQDAWDQAIADAQVLP